jgi:hypothetical protein
MLKRFNEFQIEDRIDFFLDDDLNKRPFPFHGFTKSFAVKHFIELDLPLTNSVIVFANDGMDSYRKHVATFNMFSGTDDLDYFCYFLMESRSDTEELFDRRIRMEACSVLRDSLETDSPALNTCKFETAWSEIEVCLKRGGGIVLPSVSLMVTEMCSLRCHDCSQLIPKYENPRHLPVREIIADLDALLNAVDICLQIGITGGEPFLHPSLDEILEYLIRCDNVRAISIVSNGMKIPDKKVIPMLKNKMKPIKVDLSDYGRIEKMSRFIVFLEEHDVNIHVRTNQLWWDANPGSFKGKDIYTLRSDIATCPSANHCNTVYNGKFAVCIQAAILETLGAYASGIDYIDLHGFHSFKELREKIRQIQLRDYADACNYCNSNSFPRKYVFPGVQIDSGAKNSAYTIVRSNRV